MALNPGKTRCSLLVLEMVVDASTGEVQHTNPVWAYIQSVWKGSYRLVQDCYDDGKKEANAPSVVQPLKKL
jgi:exoribonuclease R